MGPVCGVWGTLIFSRKIPIGVCGPGVWGVGTLNFFEKNPYRGVWCGDFVFSDKKSLCYGGVGNSLPLSIPLRVGFSGMAVNNVNNLVTNLVKKRKN